MPRLSSHMPSHLSCRPRRRALGRLPEKRAVPFADAQEAWFWYMRAVRMRVDGARLGDPFSRETRPCEPDDLYRAAMALRRAGRLGGEHLRVLAHFGWRQCPPDARLREEARALQLWQDALDRLTTVLKAKGIVRHDEDALRFR